MKNITFCLFFLAGFFFMSCGSSVNLVKKAESARFKALIVNGQNNHNWEIGSDALKQILEGSGLFIVDVATSPEKDADMSKFTPDFSAYDLVVLDYNGDDWSSEARLSFVNYVKNGGGVFVFHAASNSFPNWAEYNEIIGLGGWRGRNEKSGPYVYLDDAGKIIRDDSRGGGGGHGRQHEFVVTARQPEHPIMQGLPEEWLHARDELYHKLRGPAKNMTILATAWSDPATGGNVKNLPPGRHEPILMTIKYGRGRVFHTAMGHASKENQAMKCAGFIVTSLRGAEWAASGKVTQAVPENLPTKTEVVVLNEYKAE